MEVTLPISAAVESASPRAEKTSAALSVALPLRFIITAMLALLVGVAWLVVEPDLLTTYHYNQSVIALTHLFALGWICTVVMGAVYQLVPVALETKLYSECLARWHFFFHVVGFVGMVWMFRAWNMKQVGHFACVLAAGALLFAFNIGRTLLRVPRWNVVATAVVSALVWFLFTIAAGISIAAAKCNYDSAEGLATTEGVRNVVGALRALASLVLRFSPISAMHAHAHLGAVGFFTILIVGVSFKLVPMFALSEIQSKRRANISIWLLNGGLLGAFITVLLGSPWKFAFALAIVAALAVYGWEICAIVRARKRASLDWGVKSFLTAVAMLAPLSVLACVLAWPGLPQNVFTAQLETLYAFLGLLGFVTFAITGMLHKIIPFLVWFHSYSRHVGRAHVPALAEMFSERLQIANCWSWMAGLVVAGAGITFQNEIVVRGGAILLVASLAFFVVNVGKMLSHWFRPALKPRAAPIRK